VDAIAVTSYGQLLDEIHKLPPPREGAVRLFRGQTTDYGAILSSLGRTLQSKPGGEWFETSIRRLYIIGGLLSLVGELLHLPQVDPTDIRVSVANYVLADALVQHYGYQTSYVDVSPSIDVALWFATHRFEKELDKPFGKEAPFRLTFPAWHVPAKDGVVYVLDAKPWDRVSAIDDGQFVDLLPIAPEGVNRPRRQVGGLLYAPPWGAGRGDLSGLLRTKFTVRFPWEQAEKDWSTDYVFPGPAEDPIYRTLLRAPFFRTVRPAPAGGEETIFRRTCTVPEYCAGPDDTQRQGLYRTYDRRLAPTLYYPWLMRNLDKLQANPAWMSNLLVGFKRAVPIMLQRPGVLFNLRRGGPAAPPDKPPAEVPVPFRNFFLEYAPESYAVEYDESRMRRGFWCYWLDGNSFLLQSFGSREKRPIAWEIGVYEWLPEGGLVCKSGPELMGTYVTEPLNFIQMTVDGLLRLDPPGNLGHDYMELTTTEKFWPARAGWTDLL
jgi:hypothetical protein